MFTYITIFVKSIYSSLLSAKEETDTKQSKKKDESQSGQEEEDGGNNQNGEDSKTAIPEIEFPAITTKKQGFQNGFYTSSPFQTTFSKTDSVAKKEPLSKPLGSSIGNQFCLVAETQQNQRACVLVDKASDCMSKTLFPTKLDCLQDKNKIKEENTK